MRAPKMGRIRIISPFRSDEEEIRRALDCMLLPEQVTELRAIGRGGSPTILSGYFDDPMKLVRAASQLTDAKAVYFVPNPIPRTLLARSPNRLGRPGGEGLTRNADVIA